MKASFTLPNGTKVEMDGTPDDVQRVLATFSPSNVGERAAAPPSLGLPKTKSETGSDSESAEAITEMAIVNRLKEDEALAWLHEVVDSRDMTRRVLLPHYVASEVDSRAEGVTSGFISRVYTELGVRIAQANISTELSGKAKKFVLADVVRRKGAPVRYKISRAGRSYLEQNRRNA
jgi:hypothetical protein